MIRSCWVLRIATAYPIPFMRIQDGITLASLIGAHFICFAGHNNHPVFARLISSFTMHTPKNSALGRLPENFFSIHIISKLFNKNVQFLWDILRDFCLSRAPILPRMIRFLLLGSKCTLFVRQFSPQKPIPEPVFNGFHTAF